MRDPVATQIALRNQLLTVPSLPPLASTNRDFTPTAGTVYLDEQFVGQPGVLPSMRAGPAVDFGLYILTIYGLQGDGIRTIGDLAAAILAVFTPGSPIATLANGDTIRVRGDTTPWMGQLLNQEGGRVRCVVTIPFRVQRPAVA